MVAVILLAALAAPPPVTKVVLFSDRAQLTRSQPLTCSGAGGTGVKFIGLNPDFDPTTLTASAEKGAKVTGVSVSERVDTAGHERRAQELQAKLDELGAKLRAERRTRERAEAQRAQGESLRAAMEPFLNRDAAGEKKPDVTGWKSGLDQAAALIDDATARLRTSDAALAELLRSENETRSKLAAMGAGAVEKVEDVEVAVDCDGAGTVRIDISYLVANASWTPVYEARADEANGKVGLTVGGEVRQRTGEDWHGIEVVLSTGMSRRDAQAPELQTLRVGTAGEENPEKVLVARQEEASTVNAPTAPVGNAGPSRARAEDQGLSVRLSVPGKTDVPSDGTAVRVAVESLSLGAAFSRVTVPRVSPQVFRVAKLSNGARYPLPAGRVELFNGGSYLGTGRLDTTAQNAELKLNFGIDEALKVKRTTLEEQKRSAGLFGSKRRFTYAYRLELASFASKPVNIELSEQLPVSEIDDVEVSVDSHTTGGFTKDEREGRLDWKLAFSPKERKVLELRFQVDVPSKYDSSGLQ